MEDKDGALEESWKKSIEKSIEEEANVTHLSTKRANQ